MSYKTLSLYLSWLDFKDPCHICTLCLNCTLCTKIKIKSIKTTLYMNILNIFVKPQVPNPLVYALVPKPPGPIRIPTQFEPRKELGPGVKAWQKTPWAEGEKATTESLLLQRTSASRPQWSLSGGSSPSRWSWPPPLSHLALSPPALYPPQCSVTLLVALSFHSKFEGIAMGSRKNSSTFVISLWPWWFTIQGRDGLQPHPKHGGPVWPQQEELHHISSTVFSSALPLRWPIGIIFGILISGLPPSLFSYRCNVRVSCHDIEKSSLPNPSNMDRTHLFEKLEYIVAGLDKTSWIVVFNWGLVSIIQFN